MLSIKNIRASLARLISPPGLPTIALPDVGTATAPAMRIVSQSAPVAVRPTVRTVASPAMHDTFRLFEEQLKLDFDLESKLALAKSTDAHREIRAAFAQFRASKLRGKTMADIANTPFALRPAGKAAPKSGTVDDEGNVPVKTPIDGDGLDSVIASLLDSVEKLKAMLPANVDADDGDLATAKAYLATGDKKAALAAISKAHTAVGAQVAAQKKRSVLLSLPSSRERATKLTASGFNADPVVASLNAALGRGGSLSLADRASLALAPVAGRTPPAPRSAATTSRSDSRPDVVKINSLRAELSALDKLQRREGFTNERNDKHAALSRQLKAELRKFQVRY